VAYCSSHSVSSQGRPVQLEVEICEDRARAGLRHLQSTMASTMTAHVLYVLCQGPQCALCLPQLASYKGLCLIHERLLFYRNNYFSVLVTSATSSDSEIFIVQSYRNINQHQATWFSTWVFFNMCSHYDSSLLFYPFTGDYHQNIQKGNSCSWSHKRSGEQMFNVEFMITFALIRTNMCHKAYM